MNKVGLDLEKIKHLKSGLGQFCLHLGQAIIKETEKNFIQLYIPKSAFELFPFTEKKEWKSYHKLTKVKTKVTVWHSFHQEAVYFPKNKSIKRVLTIHDLNFLDNYSGIRRERMLKRLQFIVNQASAIVFISNYSKKIAESNLIIPKEVISQVIYNGIAILKDQKACKPTFINDFTPFLFTIGIVGKKKNFHVLIEMMLHLPELKLYISGNKNSDYAKEIEGLIKVNNLSDRVFLTREITEGEKIWMYKNCSGFVFPSKNEGFGLPVVEAMSFGKPLILSNLTSLPEIGGEEASYFKDFEPVEMAKIVNDTINNHTIDKSKKLIKRTELFSWNSAAKEYIKLYKFLLEEN